MNVNDVVRKMILTQPNVFKNRKDVLEHIFTSVNNGFSWDYKGDVIEISEFLINKSYWSPELEIEKIKSNKFPAFIESVVIEKAQNRIKENMRTVDLVDLQMKSLDAAEDNDILLNPDCLLCQMPENVSQEWKNAADEIFAKSKVTVSN